MWFGDIIRIEVEDEWNRRGNKHNWKDNCRYNRYPSHRTQQEVKPYHQGGDYYSEDTNYSSIDRDNLRMKKQILENEINELTIDLKNALKDWNKVMIEWYNNLIKEKRLELDKTEARLGQYWWNNMPDYNNNQNRPQELIVEHRESLPWNVSIEFLDWIYIKQVIGKSKEEMPLKSVKEINDQENYKHNSDINLINLWDTKEFDLTFNERWSDFIKWEHVEKIRVSYDSWRIIIYDIDSQILSIINVNNRNLKHGVCEIPIEKWFFKLKIN